MRTRFISDLKVNKVITNEMIDLVKKLQANFETGRCDLANGAFAIAETLMARPADKMNYQTHKKYIRVHVVLGGFEMLLLSQSKRGLLEAAPYDTESDTQYLKGGTTYEPILIQSGEYLTVYPGEVYKSGVAIPKATSREVKKLTIYIPKE